MTKEQIEKKAKEIANIQKTRAFDINDVYACCYIACEEIAEWLLDNEKVNADKVIAWFNDIAEMCGKLTSGNVSHLAATIKGMAIRSAEYVEKHINDSPWISVEDELPPLGEVVIVHYYNDNENCEMFSHRTKKECMKTDENDFCIYDNENITYWMPIPKLNKK